MLKHLRPACLALLASLLLVVPSAFAADHASKNKETIKAFIDQVINNAELDSIPKFCAADYVDHNPMPGTPKGIAGMRAMFTEMRAAFPDMKIQIDDMVASGDFVAVRMTTTGTNTGAMHGMPATGKHMSIQEIHIGRLKDGKIAEHWGNADELGMMRQLGMVPDEGMPPAPMPSKTTADRMKRESSVSNEDATAIVQRMDDAFVGKDVDGLDEIIAADFQQHGPSMGGSTVQEMKDFIAQLRSAFPDMVMTTDAAAAEGGMVAMHWTAKGTHKGDFMGMPATGKTIEVSGTAFDRVTGGKVHDHWEVFDEMGMMTQLGGTPSMEHMEHSDMGHMEHSEKSEQAHAGCHCKPCKCSPCKCGA